MGVCVSTDTTVSSSKAHQNSPPLSSQGDGRSRTPNPLATRPSHQRKGAETPSGMEFSDKHSSKLQEDHPNAMIEVTSSSDVRSNSNKNPNTTVTSVTRSPKKVYPAAGISEQLPSPNAAAMGSTSDPIVRAKGLTTSGPLARSRSDQQLFGVTGGKPLKPHLQTSNNPNSMTEEGTIPALTEDNSQNNSVLISGAGGPFDNCGYSKSSATSFRGDVVFRDSESDLSFSGDSDLYAMTKLIESTFDTIKMPDDCTSQNIARPTSNGIHQAWKPLRFPEVVRAHRMRVKVANDAVNTLTMLGQGYRSPYYTQAINSTGISVRRPTSYGAQLSYDGQTRAPSAGGSHTSQTNMASSNNNGPSPLGSMNPHGSDNRLLAAPKSPLDRSNSGGGDFSRTTSNIMGRSANASMVLGATAVEAYGQHLLAMQRPREGSAALSHMPSFTSRQTFSAEEGDAEDGTGGRFRDGGEDHSPNPQPTPNHSLAPLDGEEATRAFYARLQEQRKSIARPGSRAVVTMMGENSDDAALSNHRVLSSDAFPGSGQQLKPPRPPSSTSPTPHMSPYASMPLNAHFVDSPNVQSPFATPLKKEREIEDMKPHELPPVAANWSKPGTKKADSDCDDEADGQTKGLVPLGPARGPDLVLHNQRGKLSSGSDIVALHHGAGSGSALVTIMNHNTQHAARRPTEPQTEDQAKMPSSFGGAPTDFIAFPGSRRNTPQSHVLSFANMPEANISNSSDPAGTQHCTTATRRRRSRLSVFAKDDNGEEKVLPPHPPLAPRGGSNTSSNNTLNRPPMGGRNSEDDTTQPAHTTPTDNVVTPGAGSLVLGSPSYDSSHSPFGPPVKVASNGDLKQPVTTLEEASTHEDNGQSPHAKRPSFDTSPAMSSLPSNRRPSLQRPQRSPMAMGIAGASAVSIGGTHAGGPSLLNQRRTSAINPGAAAMLLDKRFGDALRARLHTSENERKDAVEMAQLDAEEAEGDL